eukprot:6504896-Alexandrium_andersonii.AAC.1
MARRIKVSDSDIDPVFTCRLCGAVPYIGGGADDSGAAAEMDPLREIEMLGGAAPATKTQTRTPSKCNPAKPLAWVNHVYCYDCAL